MVFEYSKWLILAVLLVTPAFANMSLLDVDATTTAQPISDPYEPVAIVPKGPFAGRRVDTSKYRSARVLPTLQAPGSDAPMLVANFQHRERYWLAEVPPDGVAEVILHHQDIPGGLGHGQIRFRMKPGNPIRLTPQVGDQGSAPVLVSEAILSIDGVPPAGIVKPDKSFELEQYPIAYLFMSLEQKRTIMGESGDNVKQYKLAISDAERQAVLRIGLGNATRLGMGTMYSLMGRNCTSEAFDVLDSAITYDHVYRALAHVPNVGVPALTELYLRQRGLLKPGVRIEDLGRDPTAR